MKLKELIWIGSSKKDFMKLPEDIIDIFGYELYIAQKGSIHPNSKVLKGFHGAGVTDVVGGAYPAVRELKESDESGTYRAVYTIKMEEVVFVLHVFQKKSKQGIKTPQSEIDIIKSRLKDAQDTYNTLLKKGRPHDQK